MGRADVVAGVAIWDEDVHLGGLLGHGGRVEAELANHRTGTRRPMGAQETTNNGGGRWLAGKFACVPVDAAAARTWARAARGDTAKGGDQRAGTAWNRAREPRGSALFGKEDEVLVGAVRD
jgi:hypothetical protein